MWNQNAGTYASLSGSFPLGGTQIYDSTYYDTAYGDFTYEVELTRTGCDTCSNTVFVRGVPSPYHDAFQRWDTGYVFSIARTGRFGAWLLKGNTVTTLQAWVAPAALTVINTASGAINRLRVVSRGTRLEFYINYNASTNPNPVFVITNAQALGGRTGAGATRLGTTTLTDAIRLNRATLLPPASAGGANRQPSATQQTLNAVANRKTPKADPLQAPIR